MTESREAAERLISLFRLYEQKMYHIAYAILNDSYQAEDAVMEAFVRLLEQDYAIDDPASDKTKGLIIQVVRSAAIDQYRKNQREAKWQTLAEDPVLLNPVQEDPEPFPFDAEIAPLIRELPKTYRDVLYLRYTKEYSTAEIARALKISTAAVRKRQERGLRLLKKKIAAKGDQYHGTTV